MQTLFVSHRSLNFDSPLTAYAGCHFHSNDLLNRVVADSLIDLVSTCDSIPTSMSKSAATNAAVAGDKESLS